MSLRPELTPDLSQQLGHLARLSTDDGLETAELPMIRVLLRGGGTLSGHVFRVEAGDRVLLGDASGSQLTTLMLSEIVGLVLETSPSTAALFGTPPRRREDAPTQLELKRRVKSIADKASARLANQLVIDERSCRQRRFSRRSGRVARPTRWRPCRADR